MMELDKDGGSTNVNDYVQENSQQLRIIKIKHEEVEVQKIEGLEVLTG